jgi:MFS superfamily sulfate permease-like transporter
MPKGFFEKFQVIGENLQYANYAALTIGALTFVIIQVLMRISIYIPAPLIALGVATALASTVLSNANLILVKTKYGDIPTNFLQFTPPKFPPVIDLAVIGELAFYAAAFAFVCGFESILAARMADRLANNNRTQYNPDKEFWGQGLIQTFVPMLNGMPLSGALARTATNIKVGAVTPLAGIMKCILKLLLAYFLADQLEMVPMACIGGILLWVAYNMIKPKEIMELQRESRFHFWLMIYTAVTVIVFGFLQGVLSALVIYGVVYFLVDRSVAKQELVEHSH